MRITVKGTFIDRSIDRCKLHAYLGMAKGMPIQ